MIDSDQEKLQSLGYFGIFKESFKIILSSKKIFTQITLSLILPLAIIYLFQIQVSDYLQAKIFHDEYYSRHYANASDTLRSEILIYVAIKIAYLVCVLVLSLLSTAAVVYTIACIYTAKEVAYKKVMKVVPRVWKRLIVTFLWILGFSFIYVILGFGVFAVWAIWLGFTPFGVVIGVILLVLYLAGFTYLSAIWHVASVVSVLEEIYGIKSMIKSKDLIKGKTKVVIGILLTLILFYIGILMVYRIFVVYWWWYEEIPVVMPLAIGIVCLLLLLCLFLLGLAVQTVIYFVCKSYHRESIEKPILAGHLDAYLTNYAPLNEATTKDVQLEQQVYV